MKLSINQSIYEQYHNRNTQDISAGTSSSLLVGTVESFLGIIDTPLAKVKRNGLLDSFIMQSPASCNMLGHYCYLLSAVFGGNIGRIDGQ